MTADAPAQHAATTADAPASAADAPAVAVRNLSHTYPPRRKPRRSARKNHAPPPQDAALDRVHLTVQPGEVVALLGPNGSGKSTLLRILATVQGAKPASGSECGSAAIFGHDIAQHPTEVRKQLGVVFQHPAIDLKLTALENLQLHGTLYGLGGQDLDRDARQALTDLGLAERMHDRTASFSGGMRRRVEIAKALLTRPRLLLMDEASAGLDLAIQRDIWADLRRRVADTGLTVLLTTHLMHEAELADRVAVMSAGRVVAIDTPDALVAEVGGQVLEITPANTTTAQQLLEQVRDELAGKLDQPDLTTHQDKIHLEHPQAASVIEPLSRALGDRATNFRLGRPNLADAYLKLTGQTLGE